jgi:hypothetical protein
MTRRSTELVREGRYAAEVEVELIDAEKLEAVRRALREGDLAAAAKHGRVFELTPVVG